MDAKQGCVQSYICVERSHNFINVDTNVTVYTQAQLMKKAGNRKSRRGGEKTKERGKRGREAGERGGKITNKSQKKKKKKKKKKEVPQIFQM